MDYAVGDHRASLPHKWNTLQLQLQPHSPVELKLEPLVQIFESYVLNDTLDPISLLGRKWVYTICGSKFEILMLVRLWSDFKMERKYRRS